MKLKPTDVARPHRPTRILLLAGAAVVAVLFYLNRGTVPVSDSRVRAAIPRGPAAAVGVKVASGTTASAASRAPLAASACIAQRIDLALGGKSIAACVGETITVQNGGLRVYTVETSAAPKRWLRIGAAGSTVISAGLGLGASPDIQAEPEFQCEGRGCKGIVIGPHDSQGVRTIAMDHAVLVAATANKVPSADEIVMVTGSLQTVAEENLPGLACTGQGVNITTSEGSALSFCPQDGAGFETGPGGNRVYRFSSLDGESVLVAVDDNQAVRQVEYRGERDRVCAAAACVGVRVSSPDPSGERTVTFAGTTVVEAQGNSGAVLNGTLRVPRL